MGVLMFEFVNGSYLEIAVVIKEPKQDLSLIDRVVDAMKRVLERVKNKMRDAFDALVSGGVQGFVSNFLTFIINNVITTSAKVVTISCVSKINVARYGERFREQACATIWRVVRYDRVRAQMRLNLPARTISRPATNRAARCLR